MTKKILTRSKILFSMLLMLALFNVQVAKAVTCAGATVIPAAPTLPYVASLTCGSTNDINSGNATACGSTAYLGGNEAVFVWTPTASYTGASIAYTGVSWTGIIVYQGCPTSGGTCVANVTNSATSKTLSGLSFTGGVTYYIVIDTWPSPTNPCPGSITLNGTVVAPCAGTPNPGNTTGPTGACSGTPFTLGIQTAQVGTGISYLWESADDAGFTTGLTTLGTAPTQSATQSTPKYYRCTVTCASSGISTVSTPLFVPMNAFLACYCPAAQTACSGDGITNVAIPTTTLNNASAGCIGGNNYSYFTPGVGACQLMEGSTYTLAVTVQNHATQWTNAWIDFNQDGVLDASEALSAAAVNPGSNGTTAISFTVPFGSVTGLTRLRIRGGCDVTFPNTAACGTNPSNTWGEVEDYDIEIVPNTACTGTPAPGNTIASSANVCPGSPVTLSLQNLTPGTGVTYQWESADDAAFTLNVQTLGTASVQVANPTTPTYYRCLVDCGGNSAYSVEVLVGINGFLNCYCSSGLGGSCGINAMSSVEILTTTLNNVTGGCTGPYNAFPASGSTTASLMAGIPYTMNVGVIAGSNTQVAIWIDYNQNGTFETSEYTLINGNIPSGSTGSGTFTIPFTALSGQTGMRVRSDWQGTTAWTSADACTLRTWGETEDYIIDIQPSSACSGTPTPGNTIASAASVCPGAPVTLSLQNLTSGTGVTYQWESADDAAFTINVQTLGTGITQTANPTTATYYRCLVDCGGNSAYSTEVLVNVNSFFTCYCPVTNAGSACITNVSMASIANTTAGCSGGSNYSQQPGTTFLTQGTNENISVTCDGGAIISVWIDFNQNGVFEATEWTQVATSSTANVASTVSVAIPPTALLGQTGMRVRSRLTGNQNGANDACLAMGSGETEDYVVEIVANTPCSGTPAPGNTLASASAVCPGSPVTLSLQTPTLGSGVTYQWESADDAAFTINVQTLGTNNTQVANPTTPTYYRCLVDCGGNSAYSIEVLVNINTFLNCYCTSVPTNAADEEIYSVTIGTSSTDPLYAGAAGCTTAAPGPGSILGRYSNFKTLAPITSIMQGDVVPFTVEENECDGAPFYPFGTGIWIDYNQDGDYNDVGEEVFKEGTTLIGPRNVTGNFTVPFTATLGTTTMRVIVAEGLSGASLTPCLSYGYGETEDFLIDIIASTACTGTPTPGNTIASATTFCAPASPITLSLQNTTTGSGVTYQWYQANDQAFTSGVVALGTGTTQSVTPSQASTWYRCEVTCSGNTGISTEVEITQNAPSACYCIPTYSSGSGFGDYIESAEISGTSLNNVSGASPSPYYTLYPQSGSTTASLSPGTTYTLNVTVGTYTLNDVAAWIDYNGNGVLNDLTPDVELLGEAYNIGAGAVASFVFTVPASLPLGDYRLRIREADQGSIAMSPCDPYTYGETEDYTISVVNPTASLLATFIIQGYYDANTGNMQPVYLNSGVGVSPTEADLVTVSLHDASAPYAQVHTFSGIQNINGQITCTFPGSAVGNSYYIVLTNRNSVETWSANPVLISASTSYDFTSSAAQAYGSNQIDVSGTGLFAIYNGDVNQDDVIDGLDFNDWETDNNNFAGGYVTTDFNGDGIVDGLDFLIWEPNNNNFIGTVMP